MKTLPSKEAFSAKATISRKPFSSAFAILCFIIISMCLSACSKDDEAGGEPAADYYFREKVIIDGTSNLPYQTVINP